MSSYQLIWASKIDYRNAVSGSLDIIYSPIYSNLPGIRHSDFLGEMDRCGR
jgi:hypothetical protein